MIKKVLVANRGEIAMRIFRTCRVMNIPTVAIYTHVDRGALHVRYAEEAYCISEDEADTSYLKPDLILEIAKKTGAAIHPGYGFLSENADFARRCEEEGVIFIGPSADVIAKMGIKTEARKIMKEAGVPVVPGTEKPVTDIEDAKKVAAEVGYPIMLKALAGGGGKGMRLVHSEDEMEAAFRMSRSEAANSFGNDAIYIEKYIENPHHIEVQVLGDKYGNVIHLYERECSIQRRNQKVIEEAPSPFVKEAARQKMLAVAVEACKKIGYYSAGTLEFMMDKDQNFYFLEMNTRLQVEHLVTEETTIPFHLRVLHNATFLKGNYDTTFIDTKFDKEDLKRRQNSDPTVAVIAAALKHYEEEKEAAARATTVPLVGESLWKHYGKLQMLANNF